MTILLMINFHFTIAYLYDIDRLLSSVDVVGVVGVQRHLWNGSASSRLLLPGEQLSTTTDSIEFARGRHRVSWRQYSYDRDKTVHVSGNRSLSRFVQAPYSSTGARDLSTFLGIWRPYYDFWISQGNVATN